MDYDYAIVGAGLTGSLISHHLSEKNISHILLDKGRGVGGRLSSKRFENISFNHGSQMISFNEYENSKWFQAWVKNSWIKKRKNHWSIEGKSSDLIKSLIDQKNVVSGFEVAQMKFDQNIFFLEGVNKESYRAKKVILTAPLPQSVKLASDWLAPEIKKQMLNVLYQKKIIFFIEKKKLLRFSTLDAFSIESKLNTHMVTFSDEISDELFEKDPLEIATSLTGLLESYFEQLRPNQIQVKKWRYSQVLNSLPLNFFESENKKVFIAGDAFGSKKPTSTERVFNSVYKLLIDSDLLR